jgi:hypothetical protein
VVLNLNLQCGRSDERHRGGGAGAKCSTTANGTKRGGKPFSRGHFDTLLSNPIYTGRIAQKGAIHPGQHPALIDDESWSAVRA